YVGSEIVRYIRLKPGCLYLSTNASKASRSPRFTRSIRAASGSNSVDITYTHANKTRGLDKVAFNCRKLAFAWKPALASVRNDVAGKDRSQRGESAAAAAQPESDAGTGSIQNLPQSRIASAADPAPRRRQRTRGLPGARDHPRCSLAIFARRNGEEFAAFRLAPTAPDRA